MFKRVFSVRLSLAFFILGIVFRIGKWLIRRVMIKKGWIAKPWENA